jgi:hypothetical protein
MFTKPSVTQSMIDAVNKILETEQSVDKKESLLLGEEKKRMLLEPELDETGFHKAAHAAKKAGQSHFEFQGKKYPATAKSHKEAIEMEEGWDDMLKAVADRNKPQPSGGSGIKKGTRYGGSKQKDEPAKDDEDDKVKKESFRDAVINVLDEKRGSGESDPLQNRADYAAANKPGQVYKKTYAGDKTGMTKAYAYDIRRAGPKGKLPEEVEELDEDGNCVTPPQAKKIAKKEVKGHEKSMHKEELSFAEKLMEKAIAMKEKKDTFPWQEEEKEMSDSQMDKREKIVMSMKDKESSFKHRYGKNWKSVMYATATKQAMKEDASDVYEEEFEQIDEVQKTTDHHRDRVDAKVKHREKISDAEKTTDTLAGRVMGGHENEHFSHKINLKRSADIKVEEVEQIDENTYHTHTAHFANQDGEWIGKMLIVARNDDDAKIQAIAACHSGPFSGCKLKKLTKKNVIMGEEKIGPLDVARDRAKKALKKIKTETMMGKIAGGI